MSPPIVAERRADGSVLLHNRQPLPSVTGSIAARLGHWAARTPDAPYLSEGDRIVSYAQAEAIRRRWSARLLGLALSAERPLMILGANGVDHALAMLAATAVGVPVAVVSPGYGMAAAAPWGKLAQVLARVDPALILADDPATVMAALAALGRTVAVRPLRDPAWLEALPDTDSAAAEAAVAPDTVAKLLFTSGSTGTPKAVITTQGMMVSNMLALALVWPFLAERPPVLVDWLPWNHVFGGNCCFNIALWFGGHLHIDAGRPAPGAIDRTVAAIRRWHPTVYFNVPLGYELLLPFVERDRDFAAEFLGRLDFLFNAGAALPASLRARLEAAGVAATGRAPVIAGGWGSTETAPFSTVLSFSTPHAGNLGVPISGTTIKLVPDGDRFELRVKGPNVTPGYWRDPAATAAAFDEEGYYRIGDAGRFADPADPAQGILFDGRVAENFKLASGTFVNVGALRLAIVSAGEGLISDAVIAGEGHGEIGALLFLNETACRAWGSAAVPAACPAIRARLAELLWAANARATGSSMRIARFAVAAMPPSAAHDEITDKGYLNQRRVLACRAADIARLYTAGDTETYATVLT